jgi:hypothetical protein
MHRLTCNIKLHEKDDYGCIDCFTNYCLEHMFKDIDIYEEMANNLDKVIELSNNNNWSYDGVTTTNSPISRTGDMFNLK